MIAYDPTLAPDPDEKIDRLILGMKSLKVQAEMMIEDWMIYATFLEQQLAYYGHTPGQWPGKKE